MFAAADIAALLAEIGVTHVIWLPDSALGPWETALESAAAFRLIRVAREAETWAIAAGLRLGGARPMIIMQTTGLFDSGDALRNAVYDLRLPLYAMVGARSFLVEDSPDTAKRFAEPILKAWDLDYIMLADDQSLPQLKEHYARCQASGRAGLALIAEGRG